jgi:hypothetical protein
MPGSIWAIRRQGGHQYAQNSITNKPFELFSIKVSKSVKVPLNWITFAVDEEDISECRKKKSIYRCLIEVDDVSVPGGNALSRMEELFKRV